MKITLKDGSVKEYEGSKAVIDLLLTSVKGWQGPPAPEK